MKSFVLFGLVVLCMILMAGYANAGGCPQCANGKCLLAPAVEVVAKPVQAVGEVVHHVFHRHHCACVPAPVPCATMPAQKVEPVNTCGCRHRWFACCRG